ncbi:hypothetical protein FQZ97_563030 [compost metagenome]
MQRFINNWAAPLLEAAPASATLLVVEESLAARLVGLGSGGHYLLTAAKTDSSGAEIAWEVIRVTGRAGGNLTVERGQEGAALELGEGDVLSARLTASALESVLTRLFDLEGRVAAMESGAATEFSLVVTVGADEEDFGFDADSGFGSCDPTHLFVTGAGAVTVVGVTLSGGVLYFNLDGHDFAKGQVSLNVAGIGVLAGGSAAIYDSGPGWSGWGWSVPSASWEVDDTVAVTLTFSL